jgi:hypothetical protein
MTALMTTLLSLPTEISDITKGLPANLPDLSSFDTTHLFAIAAALGWASGLRLYAVVFCTGLAGYMGWIPLPKGLSMLESPVVMWAAGGMLAVEFLADKVPWIDSLWDTVHTFIRVPAGAALAWGVFGGDQSQWATVAALMGGTLAATSHTAKTTTRAAVNASPEPFTNIALSLVGDAAVPAMLWLSWEHPTMFYGALGVALIIMITATVLLWKFVRGLRKRLHNHFVPTKLGDASQLHRGGVGRV